MRPDYQRIAELEYELGFTNEKPSSGPQSLANADAILKQMWTQPITDRPGQVIFYDPKYGRPSW